MTEAEVYRTPPTVRGTEEGCKGEWLGGEARVHYRRDAVTRPNSLRTDYGGFTGLAVALVFLVGIGDRRRSAGRGRQDESCAGHPVGGLPLACWAILSGTTWICVSLSRSRLIPTPSPAPCVWQWRNWSIGTMKSHAIGMWSCSAPAPTKSRAPGWRSCLKRTAYRVSVPSSAGSPAWRARNYPLEGLETRVG